MSIDFDGPFDRARLTKLAIAQAKLRVEEERTRQQQLPGGLMNFIRYFWHVLEPNREFVEGWLLEGLCAHLEAITRGEITGEYEVTRLLANIAPGTMKSLTLNCFFPAFEWGPMGLPYLRYISFSYAAHLTERDNTKFRDLISSPEYQELWGHVFSLTTDGKIKVTNDKTGFKFASSVGGVGTGERADRVLTDDAHNVHQAESDVVRENTVRWFRESMSNRLNSLKESAIVVIMQRVHEADVSGAILEDGGYLHYCVPMEYDGARHCATKIGWSDPRTEDGELAWPERFSAEDLAPFKRNPYLWAGQYQQTPAPRGGGIFRDEWWQCYEVPKSGLYEFEPLFVLASLDTAFKEKEENDYSALTVWGVYDHPQTKHRRIILMDAWRKKLPLNATQLYREKGETDLEYYRRCQPHWGLTDWVAHTCTRRKVNRLIVEDSARGYDLNAEIRRLFGIRNWGVQLVPARGDKWSRANSVVDVFTDQMVFAPGTWDGDVWIWRDWVETLLSEMRSFPKGVHDDMVDSCVHALRYLRDIGLAVRREERLFDEEELAKYRSPAQKLYPV